MTYSREVFQRIINKLQITDSGCWEYQGSISPEGYGRVKVDGKNTYCHRATKSFTDGGIPEGLVVDHLCLNKRCCNPDHLEPVTTAENNRRARLVAA
jgi:hypothetical protein